jgi:hypothetical protein
MPALVIREGPSAGHRIDVAGELELGRADSDFLQHDTEVSRRHALVRAGAEGLVIEDLGSSNGTFVNDRRISTPTPLRSGDVVKLGQTSFDVEVEPGGQPTTVRETMAPPAEAPPPVIAETPPTPAPAVPPPTPLPAAEEPAASVAEAPTEPQPPVVPPPGPPPAAPAAYGPPPSAPPSAYGPPPGPPPAYGAPVGAGARPGTVTVAGVLLLIVGAGTLLYNGWDLFLLFEDLELATSFGLGGLLWSLIVIDIFLLIFAVLEIIGGIRSFSLSRAGRALGILGAIGVIGAWIAFLVVAVSRDLTLSTLAWVALVASIAGSAAALVMLLSAGRFFPPRA